MNFTGQQVQVDSLDTCEALSQWRVINGECTQASACPFGQRLKLQYGQVVGQKFALQCTTPDEAMSAYLYETLCERKL